MPHSKCALLYCRCSLLPCSATCGRWCVSTSSKLYYILDTLVKCNSSRTLQQCLQQRQRNASLQQRKQRRNRGLRACYYSHSVKRCPEILDTKASKKSLYGVCMKRILLNQYFQSVLLFSLNNCRTIRSYSYPGVDRYKLA